MEHSIPSIELDPTGWVDRHGEYLYRYAYRRVRRAEVSEDLVQETLLAALRGRSRFHGRCSERSWLTAILKRKVVDWLRTTVRQNAKLSSHDDTWLDQLFSRGGKWKSKPDEWSSDDPGRAVTGREFSLVLGSCLDKLPPRMRSAFVLRHLDEKSTEEIRQDLAVTETNLWVLLHRSRLRLWRCLNTNWFGEDSPHVEHSS